MGSVSGTLMVLLPIVLLIGLGAVLRITRVLDEVGVDALKRLVVNVVLPAVLFQAFLAIDFQPEYLVIVVLVPALCLGLLALGFATRRVVPGASEVTPFLFTGFEFGMLGLALFTAAYGQANVPIIGMVGLGHELFIWFIFVTLLRRKMERVVSTLETVRSFATSPVILAIAAGLLLNVLGLRETIADHTAGAAVLETIAWVAATIVPIILLVVGHGTRLDRAGFRQAVPLVAARLVIVLGVALLVNALVIRTLLGLPPIVEAAIFTLLILPPPFIVPIYLPRTRRDEATYATNVLSLYTVVSVVAFIAWVTITA